MKMNYKNIVFFSVAALMMAACKPKESENDYSAGALNLSNFVAIGGTSTSGYMDDALYREGQENSLGAILAKQFEIVGGGPFYQPLVSESSVGINAENLAQLILGYKTDCLNATSLSPVRKASAGDISLFSEDLYDAAKPFGNYGIPGFYMAYAFSPAYSNQNNFFKRMASSNGASVIGDALSSSPTFFSLYVGLDDILAYAKVGGKNTTLLTASQFQVLFSPIIDQVTSNVNQGIVSTLPDVTEMPYFNTIPYDGLNLDEANAASLNAIYNPIGLSFVVGKNAFVIEDPSAGAFGVRQMVPGEKILLSVPLDSVKCNKMGSIFPLRDEFVLTLDEVNSIKNNTVLYNNYITSKAAEKNIALVETDDFYKALSAGIVFNGIGLNPIFVSGGAYSLDGINLNPRGNALLANEFIKAINAKYKSPIPRVDATLFRGVIFP
jgi:hypothetical protein